MIGCGVLQARARTSVLSRFASLVAVAVVTTVEIRVNWGRSMFLLAFLNSARTSIGGRIL
jgi:hypothetical protein